MNKGFTPLQQAVAKYDVDYLDNHIRTHRPDLIEEWDFLQGIRQRAISEQRLISDFLPYDEYSARISKICDLLLYAEK